jgi:hypothetical protein
LFVILDDKSDVKGGDKYNDKYGDLVLLFVVLDDKSDWTDDGTD